MIYTGIIIIRKECEGSKSEGLYAYLNDGHTEFCLYRNGMYPINDDFFFDFNGKYVEVEGTVTDDWLEVDSIAEVHDGSTVGLTEDVTCEAGRTYDANETNENVDADSVENFEKEIDNEEDM